VIKGGDATRSAAKDRTGPALRGGRPRIRTAGKVELPSLGIHDPHCMIYAPIAYRSFLAAIRHVTVVPGRDVFVDYGAGKGRVLALAAGLPFARVIGVEIAPALAQAAEENLRRSRSRRRGGSVTVILGNAAAWPLDDEATVLHFFDPFRDGILERTVEQIRLSLERAPRRITILFADANHFDPLAARSGWIRAVRDVPYPYREPGEAIRFMYRIYQAELPPAATRSTEPPRGPNPS